MKLLACTRWILLFNVSYSTFCTLFLLFILHSVATFVQFLRKHRDDAEMSDKMGKYSATLMIFLSFGTIVARAVFVFHEDGCYGWPSDGAAVSLLRMVYMILFAGQS